MSAPGMAMQALTRCVLDTRYGDLPENARRSATIFLMDSVSVGVSGYATDTARAVRTAVAHWGQGDSCSVLGSRERLPMGSAAFVNAFQVHCQEYDCLHEPATVHAMAVLTGALLAMAEQRGYSGQELLLGTVLGVEVAVALGLSATRGLSFFRPATAGAMGACAALARLEGFSEQQFLDAMGLAYSQLAGTMQAHVEGTVALPLQVATAARAAVNSIELAAQALAGPHDVLEGPFGYFKLFEPGGEPAAVMGTLGKPWRVTELSHKPFPTGRAAHATLDGVRQLIAQHDLNLDEVRAVRADVPPLIARLVARPYKPSMGVNYARLCLPYLVGALLRDGDVDTGSFDAASLNDPDIAAFAPGVRCEVDDNPDPNALFPQRITLITRAGDEYRIAIPATLGSPENPLNASARSAKLAHCFQSNGMGDTQAMAFERCFERLEQWENSAEMLKLTRPV